VKLCVVPTIMELRAGGMTNLGIQKELLLHQLGIDG
jgi:hypothetical protein